MEIIIGIAVFALQLGAYALWTSYRKAAVRVQLRQDTINTRARLGGGRFIGGADRPGEN